MKRIIIILLSLLLSGCSLVKYLPTKYINITENININAVDYEYYQKFINEDIRNIYKIDNDNELINLFYSDLSEKEIYYECNENININKVLTKIRSIYSQRIRIFHGTSKDFGMIRVEYHDRNNEELVIDKANQVIDEIISQDMNTFDKIKAVHDYIILNTVYDERLETQNGLNINSFSSYGVLFDKTAVCEGYARTFLLFMNLLEIPCVIIESIVMNHAFNYVLVDNEWKFIDVTFDDPTPDIGKIYYTYFLLDAAEFLEDKVHIFDNEASEGVSLAEYQAFVEELNWKNKE